MNEKKNIMLSVVVIAKNEEQRIGSCLDSVSFADEIVVVDNGSSDRTVAIAKEKKAAVITVPGVHDFSALRTIGFQQSNGEWILYVDADEKVPEDLKKEILDVIRTSLDTDGKDFPVCYFLKRRNFYLGREWPKKDRMQRLFYKKALISWEGVLHETARVKGSVAVLEHPLIHDTHRTLVEMTQKTNDWSTLEAKLRLESGHPNVVPWRLVRVMATGFWRSFVMDEGWKAGTVGWIESIYQSFSMFITYAKLWEMQEKQRK